MVARIYDAYGVWRLCSVYGADVSAPGLRPRTDRLVKARVAPKTKSAVVSRALRAVAGQLKPRHRRASLNAGRDLPAPSGGAGAG